MRANNCTTFEKRLAFLRAMEATAADCAVNLRDAVNRIGFDRTLGVMRACARNGLTPHQAVGALLVNVPD